MKNRGPRRLSRETEGHPRIELLVFTEGVRTEVDYLTHIHRAFRDSMLVTIDTFHGGPLQLVEHAVAAREEDLRAQRRQRGRSRDQYWCVFDTDEHPHMDQALALAATNSIRVAISNPCIELWFLLHYFDQEAFIDRGSVQRKWDQLTGSKDKSVSAEQVADLIARFPAAKSRAARLDRKHHLDGSPPLSNPSSSMKDLIEVLLTQRLSRDS